MRQGHLKQPWRFFPVVIVASGPSLTLEQCELVRQRRDDDAIRVIVINDCYQRVPNADLLFAMDGPWWRLHLSTIETTCPAMPRMTCDAQAKKQGAEFVHAMPGRGVAPAEAAWIRRGSSSGFAAVGIAIKRGAQHIVLVGFDAKRSKDGKSHWFGDHPKDKLPAPQPFTTWAEEYDSLAQPCQELGIRIVNSSLDSATRKLPRASLEEEIWTPTLSKAA